MNVKLRTFLTSGADRDESSASHEQSSKSACHKSKANYAVSFFMCVSEAC